MVAAAAMVIGFWSLRSGDGGDPTLNRRRSSSNAMGTAAPSEPLAGQTAEAGGAPLIVWYAALIGFVLLLAALAYIYILHQERDAWRRAADQLTIGQEFLRADRDDVLKKARDRDAALSVLEAASQEDRGRLKRLEGQRDRLKSDVLRLTQELAENRGRAGAPEDDAEHLAAVEELEREKARLDLDLEGRKAEIDGLRAEIFRKDEELAERARTLEVNAAEREVIRGENDDLKARAADLEGKTEELGETVQSLRESVKQRQILRGHQASLGEVTPYIAEVGPEDWLLIEDWLAQQLRRPMALPDLTEHGWTYEGARLLGNVDGPPMAMLLYADVEENPVSLTITRDQRGERGLVISELGGLNVLDWREERHAFTLAGKSPGGELQPIALQLMSDPPVQQEEAPVPISRYVRPAFRPSLP